MSSVLSGWHPSFPMKRTCALHVAHLRILRRLTSEKIPTRERLHAPSIRTPSSVGGEGGSVFLLNEGTKGGICILAHKKVRVMC